MFPVCRPTLFFIRQKCDPKFFPQKRDPKFFFLKKCDPPKNFLQECDPKIFFSQKLIPCLLTIVSSLLSATLNLKNGNQLCKSVIRKFGQSFFICFSSSPFWKFLPKVKKNWNRQIFIFLSSAGQIEA